MKPDERMKEIFQELLDTPADRRAAFLDRACAGQAMLRQEMEALLKDHEAAGGFLASPTGGDGRQRDEPLPGPGALIGPYHLLEEIGEGGFGIVYVAEQREPVRRRVALKVIRPGMDTREVVARFEAERQALALMDHPGIARVFDGGATAGGRPYFVMELVRGVPISTYSDQCQLPLRERLELFVQVCRAVQHAHQKGVIHRDLKPTNVLVAIQDGKPVPKVIDFGVAKAAGQRLTAETFHTRFAQMIGTPQYMSPEQAEMSPLDVDTRSDVYSLGVILYELLTGTTPIARERMKEATFDELRRLIREEPPPTPSARLSRLNGQGARVAEARRTDLRRLVRAVHGDLDWIVMRALEKDRVRRYETAAALAADVERHLRHEPVEARPPSAWYRARRFVRRHLAFVTAAALVFAALVAGIAGTTAGLVRALGAEAEAQAQRDLAEEQAAVAQAVSDFLQNDLLRQAEVAFQPGGDRDPDVKVRTLLDRAAASVEGRFAGQPRTEAALRSTLGGAYYELGLYAEAEQHLRRALDLRTAALGPDHADTTSDGSKLATVCAEQGRCEEAEALYLDVLRRQAKALGAAHPSTLATKDALASLYADQGKHDEAETLYLETLGALVETLGEGHRDTCTCKNNLATLRWEQGRYDLAEALLKEVLEILDAELGWDHPRTLATKHNLARLYHDRGRDELAEPLLREALSACEAKLGGAHPGTLFCKDNLAAIYVDQGRYDLAEALYIEVVEGRTAALGADHALTLKSRGSLALLCKKRGEYDRAEPLYVEVLRAQTAALGPVHEKTLDTKNNLAMLHHSRGRYGEAERLLREVLEARAALEPHHPDLLRTKANLALVLKDQGKYDEAEPLLVEVVEARMVIFGAPHRATLSAKHNLAELHLARGRWEKAEALYREVLDACVAAFGPADPDTLGTQNGLGHLHLARGEHARSAEVLRDAAGIALPAFGATHPVTQAILLNLATCLEQMGRPGEAEPYRRELADASRERDGADSPKYAAQLAALGLNLLEQEKDAEAEPVLRECLAIREGREPDAWTTFNCMSMLGGSLVGRKAYAEAEPLLVGGYEGMKQREAEIPAGFRTARLTQALERLVQLHEGWGKEDEAAAWRTELERRRETATERR